MQQTHPLHPQFEAKNVGLHSQLRKCFDIQTVLLDCEQDNLPLCDVGNTAVTFLRSHWGIPSVND